MTNDEERTKPIDHFFFILNKNNNNNDTVIDNQCEKYSKKIHTKNEWLINRRKKAK